MEHDKGKRTLFYCCFGHYRMLAYKISACEVRMICWKPTEACKNPLPIVESRTGKPAMVILKIQADCSMVHDMFLWANIYVRSHLGCGADSVSSVFLQVSQIFQRCKSDANKQDFENKLNLTCHAQSTPKTTGILTKVFSTSGPNLVALAWTGDELLRGQAQNGVDFYFEVKFDLEGQGQSPPPKKKTKNNRDLNQGLLHLWYKFGDPSLNGWWVITRTNLVTDGRTDWRLDGQTQATTIPEGQYWPRVKRSCWMFSAFQMRLSAHPYPQLTLTLKNKICCSDQLQCCKWKQNWPQYL